MDKLVEDLLGIEQAAKDSLEDLEEERAALPRRISEEIARRLVEIGRKADLAIQTLKQESEASTQAALSKIESQYQKKAAQLNALFDANREAWRKEWADHVLQRGRL